MGGLVCGALTALHTVGCGWRRPPHLWHCSVMSAAVAAALCLLVVLWLCLLVVPVVSDLRSGSGAWSWATRSVFLLAWCWLGRVVLALGAVGSWSVLWCVGCPPLSEARSLLPGRSEFARAALVVGCVAILLVAGRLWGCY